MNYYLLSAGIVSLFAVIGHFTIGSKEFLNPVLDSGVDEIPKKVMQSIFHYMSVYMVLTTIILMAFSFGNRLIFSNTHDVVKGIALSYGGFAIVQFTIALTSPVKKGVIKLFQWVFWALIAFLCLISVG